MQKLTKKQKFVLIMEYSDRILDLVNNAQEMTTSDLQGGTEALIISLLVEIEVLQGNE